MKKQINKIPDKVHVEYGVNKLLAKRFNCSTVWVSNCLNGKSNSIRAKKMRSIAVKEYNGIDISNQKLIR